MKNEVVEGDEKLPPPEAPAVPPTPKVKPSESEVAVVSPTPAQPPAAKPKPVLPIELPKARPPVFQAPPKVTARSVEILPPGSELPSLLVEEDESPLMQTPPKSPKLVLSGEMRSRDQFRETVNSLGKALPGHAITSKVIFVKHAQNVDWQNRVDALWGTYFIQVTDGSWEYNDGFVVLKGTVKDQFTADSLNRLATTIMSGTDVKGIQNFLRVE